MKAVLIVSLGAVALGGCFPASPDGRPWYGESYHGSAEHRALEARYAAQRRAAAERDGPRLERERRIEAQVSACQEQNSRARHSARLYGQRKYQYRNCDELRRQP
jgi:hypothetical protein